MNKCVCVRAHLKTNGFSLLFLIKQKKKKDNDNDNDNAVPSPACHRQVQNKFNGIKNKKFYRLRN